MRGHVKALRAQMTEAERGLWGELRGHRFEGWAFRRQVPMGAYVADFVCHQAKPIIELDGGQHNGEHDTSRDAWFAGRGYRVLRYWNTDVLSNRDGVLEDLAAELARRSGDRGGARPAVSPPSPSLPRKGGGGAVRGRMASSEASRQQMSSGDPAPLVRGEPSPLAGEGREGGETAGAGRAAEAHASASANASALSRERAEAAPVSPPTPTLPRKGGGGTARGNGKRPTIPGGKGL